MKDMYGTKIEPGNYIVYAVRRHSRLTMKTAYVREIGINYCRVTTLIKSVWRNDIRAYNTIVHNENTTLVIKDIPDEYKTKLLNLELI